jgi:phage host-nuclease inhibitor protein Gam
MNELETREEQEEPIPQGFMVDSLEKAEWCLSKIGAADVEVNRFSEMAAKLKAGYCARIDARLDQITRPHLATKERMVELVRPWADVEVAKANGRKSVKLLSGTVGYRQSPASLVVTDEGAAILWLKNNDEESCIRIKEEVSKKAVKELIEERGELPDGCELKQGEIRFYAEPLPPLLEPSGGV